MKLPVYVLDSFTADRFKGNPTVVCVLEEEMSSGAMHAIAKEFNLPVAAFISHPFLSPVRIRYFTSTGEIPACGHATLAAAFVVAELTGKSTASFVTVENRRIDTRQQDMLIYMQYPKFGSRPYEHHPGLLKAMSIDKVASSFFCGELDTLFLEMEDPLLLKQIQPDFAEMMRCEPSLIEIVVTSTSDDPQYDYLLRSFCPWIGIDEDPVTGSVHSVLGPFWYSRLRRPRMQVYQASERGGQLVVKALPDSVELGGRVVVTLRGTMTV
jgi:PhzF family phenazine biosynthesis protein